jgi:NADPH-dependent 2,4-dienoyl-CoA reductase/sulfur reductase-like enzyme
MSERVRQQSAIDGKFPAPETSFDVIVVGAGASGTAAALAAVKEGKSVLLVDENPVPGHMVGNDVPYFFGGRATAATQNSERMLETLFMNTARLEEAIEAGVELLLGTCAWGVFRNGPLVASLPGQVVGLADGEHSWMVGFDSLVLATGARDLPMAFPGWNQPGVMGAAAHQMLLRRYDAFAGKRILIAGSHDLALETALLAKEKGLEVAGLVEVRATPQGCQALTDAVAAAGIPILCNCHMVEAKGGIDGVEQVTLSNGETITCDTLVMAIGLVPMIELADAVGSKRIFDPHRGGHIAVEDAAISAVGKCAGVADSGFDHIAYRYDWLNALGGACGGDTIVCQCEEMTVSDLLGVQPPRYLERPSAMRARSLKTLLADGPVNQDQIKRLTRSGMGACQGRRCRDQVAMMLAVESSTELSALPLATHRAPVRPLPLNIIADWQESQEMRDGWDVWMGIPTQWVPYADIGTPFEEENRRVLGGNMRL